MPVKRKTRSGNTETTQKSKVKKIFNRYNKEKITGQGVKRFLLALFYRIGYTAELELLLISKSAKSIWYITCKYGRKIKKEIKIFVLRMFDTVFEDIGKPMSRIKASFFNVNDILKASKQDKTIKASKEIKQYIFQGVKKHSSLVPNLISYLVPTVCFIIMIFAINIGISRKYAVQINLEGESIGVVTNYTVFQNANNVIKSKLVTMNDEQKWEIKPTIKLVTEDDHNIYDERQLADSILSASDENIVTASGLYVDGNFFGAVKSPVRLQTALDGLLSPYQTGEENKTVTFLEDVSVMEGVFFTDTVVDENQLVGMVEGEVEGEKFYTVVGGDSPSLVASKNGLRLKQLYALNPELEGGGLWPGDQLLVGQAVPFLRIKEIVRESYEVQIKYKSEQKPNNDMMLGNTKVTQKGENGIDLVTSDVIYIDGIRDSETIISTERVKEPVVEIMETGRRIPTGGILETAGTGAFGWPIVGNVRLSRGFAGQFPAHNGLDLAGPYGTTIVASDSGVVIKAAYTNYGYGVHLIIDHGNGYQSLYGHCSSLLVTTGQRVSKGEVIARIGSTGNSTGNHLHFEIKSGDRRFDPYTLF